MKNVAIICACMAVIFMSSCSSKMLPQRTDTPTVHLSPAFRKEMRHLRLADTSRLLVRYPKQDLKKGTTDPVASSYMTGVSRGFTSALYMADHNSDDLLCCGVTVIRTTAGSVTIVFKDKKYWYLDLHLGEYPDEDKDQDMRYIQIRCATSDKEPAAPKGKKEPPMTESPLIKPAVS